MSSRATDRGRDRSGARRSRRRRRRAPATRSAPNLRRGCGDVLRVAQRGLTVELRLAEPCPPEAVGRSPRSSCQPHSRRQAGDGLEERQVDLLGDGLVADGDELVGDVAHEQGHAPAVAAPGRRPERGVVDGPGTASIRPAAHTRRGRHPTSPETRIVKSDPGARTSRRSARRRPRRARTRRLTASPRAGGRHAPGPGEQLLDGIGHGSGVQRG